MPSPPRSPPTATRPSSAAISTEAAIKLAAQIKQDAGAVTKPVAHLRKDADAAFQKSDFRNGMVVLGQLVTAAPDDAAAWLRLARAVRQIRPRDDREKNFLLERASTAAYIAYQRAKDRAVEADSLALLGRHARRAASNGAPALDAMRHRASCARTPTCAATMRRLRLEHGFRMLDFSVDSDAAAPRACVQFSEDLPGKKTDFSPFVAVAGIDKPAISLNEKQLCVEGLKHGERYAVTLRAGLPSMVNETLAKTTEFTIFVRDRRPFVRFSGKAFVLPRTGQRGIPVLSVNTKAVEADDLSHRRPQSARHRARQQLPVQSRAAIRAAARQPTTAQRCGTANSRSSPSSTPR